jgi:hypothetical protein
MTRRRDLGMPLALAGLGIVVVAVIVGIIAVGGPGDARDRRLDELTMGRIHDVLNISQCAFNGAGAAPASIDQARETQGWLNRGNTPGPCSLGTQRDQVPVSNGASPASPGDVTYERLSADQIRICGNFRRPSRPNDNFCNGVCVRDPPYAAFYELRPNAGVHCFDIKLETPLSNPLN